MKKENRRANIDQWQEANRGEGQSNDSFENLVDINNSHRLQNCQGSFKLVICDLFKFEFKSYNNPRKIRNINRFILYFTMWQTMEQCIYFEKCWN